MEFGMVIKFSGLFNKRSDQILQFVVTQTLKHTH
jgi:hypothetical protein